MQNRFVSQLAAKGGIPVYFITCKNNWDRDCYYYIISTPQKIRLYEQRRSGKFNLNDYGEIIASGYGKAPSDSMRSMLAEKYGIKIF